MEPIRLCFVLPAVWPLISGSGEKTGGAEINLLNLARRFAMDPSYRVTFLVGDYGQPDSIVTDGIRFFRIRNYNQDVESFSGFFHLVVRELSLLTLIFRHGGQVCLTSCGGGILGRIAMLKRVRQFKVVFRFANDFDTDPDYLRKAGALLVNRLYLYGLKHADCLVTQTSIQQRLLREKMGYGSIVIRNGFEIRSMGRLMKKAYILWVASASPVKRPSFFIQLAQLLPEKKFIMIMPGNGETAENTLSEADGVKNLTVIRGVPFSQSQKWYDEAEWFVNTSTFEGFPNSFLQAFLAMTPVLSMCINPDNILDREGLGFICNDDLSLAASIIRETDEETRLSIGQRGLAHVIANYDVRDKKEAYDRIIRSLLPPQNTKLEDRA
jgi:glycosyltransferase involved in cell wall biosynthesis